MKHIPITGAQFDELASEGVDFGVYFDEDLKPFEGSIEELMAECGAISDAVSAEHADHAPTVRILEDDPLMWRATVLSHQHRFELPASPLSPVLAEGARFHCAGSAEAYRVWLVDRSGSAWSFAPGVMALPKTFGSAKAAAKAPLAQSTFYGSDHQPKKGKAAARAKRHVG